MGFCGCAVCGAGTVLVVAQGCVVVYSKSITQTKGKKMNTLAKTLYVGETQGEVLCEACAGYTLGASIKNATPKQTRFSGINGERFYAITSPIEGIDGCEGGC